MKSLLKKSVVVTGVLACLFASTAFAQRVTTTPERDKVTQAAAMKENQAYDAAHGYTNENPAAVKREVAKKVAERIKEAKNAAWEQDKETQAEAVKENKDFDKAHGYSNETPAVAKREVAKKVAERIKEAKNAAWEQDKETQAEALKENKDFDKAHGYTNRTPAEAAPAPAVKKAAPADESWKDAVARDKATQEAALKENREYDAARGYENK